MGRGQDGGAVCLNGNKRNTHHGFWLFGCSHGGKKYHHWGMQLLNPRNKERGKLGELFCRDGFGWDGSVGQPGQTKLSFLQCGGNHQLPKSERLEASS